MTLLSTTPTTSMIDDGSISTSSSRVNSVGSFADNTNGIINNNNNNNNNMVITLDGSNNDTKYRAVHQISLNAISHNYNCVDAAASQQKCDVIVVVKADGYGHGAIDTAIHLADSVGANAFAVATLEEGIHLRKALEASAAAAVAAAGGNSNASNASTTGTPPMSNGKRLQQQQQQKNQQQHPKPPTTINMNGAATAANTATAITNKKDANLSNLFSPPAILLPSPAGQATASSSDTSSTATSTTGTVTTSTDATSVLTTTTTTTSCITFRRRAAWIRILVLGPPVGYPRCFDDYYYHNLECMVSGPEVAAALYDWAVTNPLDIQRRVVERVAQETKEQIIAVQPQHHHHHNVKMSRPEDNQNSTTGAGASTNCGHGGNDFKSATLSGTSGNDLAKEFRQLLLNHQKQQTAIQIPKSSDSSACNSGVATPTTIGNAPSVASTAATKQGGAASSSNNAAATSFGGIEAAALDSRYREKVAQHQVWIEDSASTSGGTTISTTTTTTTVALNSQKKRKLRWHALVDTGMGRLGFKTDAPLSSSERRDTVDILQELVRAELVQKAPLEFYGMCTHMAEASSTSTYTNDQIIKFKSLLKRVRDAGISIPTVSTDNSAALLTTSLKHFDPEELLKQPGLNTRGYVRIGGAIYGQRPAFTQLQAASKLQAAVRHVAILKQGESVGYDRAYIAPHNVRIATLTIGFADGYPRELGNGRGQVAIRSKLYPVAGNVCMDMMMVELGPSEELNDVVVGDVAVLWGGEYGVPLQDVAAALQTTQSALTCGLNKTRVSREYRK